MRAYPNRHEPAQKTYIIHNDILDISPPHEGRVRRCVRAAARSLWVFPAPLSFGTALSSQPEEAPMLTSSLLRTRSAPTGTWALLAVGQSGR